jgi:hypothetical protein
VRRTRKILAWAVLLVGIALLVTAAATWLNVRLDGAAATLWYADGTLRIDTGLPPRLGAWRPHPWEVHAFRSRAGYVVEVGSLPIGAAGAVLLLAAPVMRWWKRKFRGRCMECGYSLAGLPESTRVCPECGAARDAAMGAAARAG